LPVGNASFGARKGGFASAIQLEVERGGALSVIEAVSVPIGTTVTRRVPLKVPAPHNRVRVDGVRDVVIEGTGIPESCSPSAAGRSRRGPARAPHSAADCSACGTNCAAREPVACPNSSAPGSSPGPCPTRWRWGEARRWVDAFAEPKEPLELYWYERGKGPLRAGEFASALVGAFAGARPGASSPGRSLLPASSP
jgi:hypothetical protein